MHSSQVHVWDTVGMERKNSLTSNYYKAAHAVLLVFAVDDSSSLNALSKWIEDVSRYAPEETKTFLVGNKVDLDKEEFQVETSRVKSFAVNSKMTGSYLVSALTGEGVMEMFDDVVRELKRGSLKPSMPKGSFLVMDASSGNKTKTGCPCWKPHIHKSQRNIMKF